MPSQSRFGEQIGIRVSVFNYMTFANEVTVVLQGSDDYQFVHVEEHGFVTAYNARLSGGDHEFFIYIQAQDAKVVYIPIRPLRLGDIDVKVYAVSRFAKDSVTKTIHVEVSSKVLYHLALNFIHLKYFYFKISEILKVNFKILSTSQH